MIDLEVGGLGKLLDRGLAVESIGELALYAVELAQPLPDVHGQADRAPAVLQPALDRLANPQRGVGGEAKALAPVELLDRSDQAQRTLLNQIGHGQAVALVAPGDRDD